jgi:phage gp46-like protein
MLEIESSRVAALLAGYGIRLELLAGDAAIPGSYWGDPEAGLLGSRLLARPDTPLHSVLHEACHYICATPERRAVLVRDAGGDEAEENAVCFLQILLAAGIEGAGSERLMQDMDAWGYSFRLGSAGAWYREDAADALSWLQQRGVVDAAGQPTGALRC